MLSRRLTGLIVIAALYGLGYCPGHLTADEQIRLPADPDLSPDGSRLAFSWRGDIWLASSKGGVARQLTRSPARDRQPKFSPDGGWIAFVSDRSGSNQVHRIAVRGGAPEQLTFHSEGCRLEQWVSQDQLLISAVRDHFWRHAERFFLIDNEPRSLERLQFDAAGDAGRIPPDGNSILFTREGTRWWRKGYRGSQASQVWIYRAADRSFEQLCNVPTGARSPLWHPDGTSFYYVNGESGAFNVWQRNLETGEEQQLTEFADDAVVQPCLSADGSVMVFRNLFDFYRLEPGNDAKPKKLRLIDRGDELSESEERRILTSASDVAFSNDGLEIAFVAGGDIWVMDTVLREPVQVTRTVEEERDPAFSPDGKILAFVSDQGGQSDLWRAVRKDDAQFWWQNDEFSLEQLTKDAGRERSVQWSPDGSLISFVKDRGDLWVIHPDGKEPKRLFESWNIPDYDWSPDGKWLVYSLSDDEFNRDIFLWPIDGSREPFNLSLHPDNDGDPAWSPDGKVIAFAGRRVGQEVDIYFVYLQQQDDQQSARDRKLKQALEKMRKVRKAAAKPKSPMAGSTPAAGNAADPKAAAAKPAPKLPTVRIDFDGIADRIRQISVADSVESGLFWSHDSKKLAFAATIGGKRGTYTVSPPAELTPKLLSTQVGSQPRWIAAGNQIVWLSSGKPASLSATGQAVAYAFSARQAVDVADRYAAGFDQCWREMRDNFYDERLNNRNWDAIRRKYQPLARGAADNTTFATIVNMMLGELNGSHLGFYPASSSSSRTSGSTTWRDVTPHLGVRFDSTFKGPGLKVRDVIYKSPASRARSRLQAGDVILSIDNTAVDPEMELTQVLNGRLDRDIALKVKDKAGKERDVSLRPISYAAARELLYEQWVRANSQATREASKGRFGYVHIRGMNMTSFYRFERELYAVAAGKEGLVIDVRENGGGSTTDHLLTVLTQPVHAITVPRGGGRGYPQDRKVYATWNKPIVVLCNQNSFSNAEIFSHAIKTLKRGQVVGVTTAGGVISTGATRIMDLGLLRKPFRGWFLMDGQDMELNGAVPHHIIWPLPGEWPAGTDTQLDKAIEILTADVKAWKQRPQPKLIKASEREGRAPGGEAP